MAKSEATWIEIDPATLGVEIAQAYQAYKQAYQVMKANRVAFEGAMASQAELPTGKKLAFGYNFGKLSIAIVEDDKPKAKATPKLSLADFLAGQASQGRAA